MLQINNVLVSVKSFKKLYLFMQDPAGTFSLQPVHVVVFGLFTLTMINYNYFSLQSVANLFFF